MLLHRSGEGSKDGARTARSGAMSQTTAIDGTAGRGRAKQQLLLGALGVVYGDIGTSPLYAVKQCFVELGQV
ncbi:MAG TPA: KUP/HAK/KT family potassium transporter, partial [Beijerinckiaceae bacterium]|nr:KUP/HAK/KT family potassium transporter [Beijerinckiaceae bacterium]